MAEFSGTLAKKAPPWYAKNVEFKHMISFSESRVNDFLRDIEIPDVLSAAGRRPTFA